MKNRFFAVIAVALFIFSCSRFVNLGDKEKSDDNTEGLPSEISEDSRQSGDAEAGYDNWNEDNMEAPYDDGSGDEVYSDADSYNENDDFEEWGDEDANPDSQSDDWNSHEYPDEEVCRFPDCSPFPEGFSNADCDCGENQDYEPVCCNGVITVFNSCFANCYAQNSSNKICSVYNSGLCEKSETDSDTDEMPENDSDTEENDEDLEIIDDSEPEIQDLDEEVPDSDEDTPDPGCGCSPENEPSVFSCGDGLYFVTSCLAECFCEDPEKLFL